MVRKMQNEFKLKISVNKIYPINKVKKNHIISSIKEKKAFHKTQQPFHDKREKKTHYTKNRRKQFNLLKVNNRSKSTVKL